MIEDNVAGPRERVILHVRDHKKDLFLVIYVGVSADSKDEGTLSEKVLEFQDFAGKRGRRSDFQVVMTLGRW